MNSTEWVRSPQSRALLWATLVMSLVLGTSLVTVDRHRAGVSDQHAAPLTDAQAVEQVVGSARQVVAAAQLQGATGGYTFVSCENENEPPYQAALYMSFVLPHSDWARYLNEVASTMIVHGWADAPAKAEHLGRKLTRGGVTAVLQRNVDDTAFATIRLYGECRNTADHRNDNPAWTEVGL
jgi:hypothetical protein